jgi:hypothetical protein
MTPAPLCEVVGCAADRCACPVELDDGDAELCVVLAQLDAALGINITRAVTMWLVQRRNAREIRQQT